MSPSPEEVVRSLAYWARLHKKYPGMVRNGDLITEAHELLVKAYPPPKGEELERAA